MEESGSVAMLAGKRSIGVAPEVNFRECGTHTSPQSTNKALKPKEDVTRSPKQGYQWPLKKIFKKHIPFKTSNTKQTEV